MPRVTTEKPTAKDDLKITMSVNGESFDMYISQAELKSRSKKDTPDLLNDEVTCSICCAQKSGFAACMARCIYGDGKCCDSGKDNCS